MYLPAIVMVGYYFEKRRAFATGVAVCGSGIGAFVFAPLCEKLLDTYAWKGGTLVLAAIVLNGMVCGALFRPLEDDCRSSKPRPKPCIENETIVNNVNCNDLGESDDVSKPRTQSLVVASQSFEPKGLLRQKIRTSLDNPDKTKAKSASPKEENQNVFVQSMQNISSSPSPLFHYHCTSKSCDEAVFDKLRNDDKAMQKIKEDLRRPLVRKDIFYAGSIQHLPEYKHHEHRDSYVRSITSIPEDSTDSVPEGCCAKFRQKMKSTCSVMKQMLDLTLLANPVFLIYGISCFLCMTGECPLVYTKPFLIPFLPPPPPPHWQLTVCFNYCFSHPVNLLYIQ